MTTPSMLYAFYDIPHLALRERMQRLQKEQLYSRPNPRISIRCVSTRGLFQEAVALSRVTNLLLFWRRLAASVRHWLMYPLINFTSE